MKRVPLLVLAVPVAAALAATALFFLQGGIRCRARAFDRAIGILGPPSILLVEAVPLAFPESSDLLTAIWLPALGNCVAWALAAAAFRATRSSSGAT